MKQNVQEIIFSALLRKLWSFLKKKKKKKKKKETHKINQNVQEISSTVPSSP